MLLLEGSSLLLLLVLAFLFPLAVYCLILAMLNRRLQPALVSGSWDLVGLLFAASGFLLIDGPALLAVFYHRNLNEIPGQGGGPVVPATFGELWAFWWSVWLVYFAV